MLRAQHALESKRQECKRQSQDPELTERRWPVNFTSSFLIILALFPVVLAQESKIEKKSQHSFVFSVGSIDRMEKEGFKTKCFAFSCFFVKYK